MTNQQKGAFKALEEHLENLNKSGVFSMNQSATNYVLLSKLWSAMIAPKEVKEVLNKEEKS